VTVIHSEETNKVSSVNSKQLRTDRMRPLAWVFALFVLSSVGMAIGLESLKQYELPRNPIIAQFFISPGRHLWIARSEDGKCRAAISGGWRKKELLGERARFKFNVRPANPTTFGSEISGEIKGEFSDYKNLISLQGKINDRVFSFDGNKWHGLKSPPREVILMVEGAGGSRLIRLPTQETRSFEKDLLEIFKGPELISEVDSKTFKECLSTLTTDSYDSDF